MTTKPEPMVFRCQQRGNELAADGWHVVYPDEQWMWDAETLYCGLCSAAMLTTGEAECVPTLEYTPQ